jgi:glucose/arabinose dehydrogenase
VKSFHYRIGAPTACVALALLGAGAAARAQQTPAAAPAQTPAVQEAPRTAAGGGGGRPVTKPLENGPWDFATEKEPIRVTVVTKNLDHPWGMAFLPDGGMLVTERPGRLRVVRNGVLDPTPIGGLPAIRAAVIGGLSDVILHPKFARNRLIYFSYSKPDAKDPSVSTLAVARARWDGGAALADVEDVFVAPDWYGSTMAGTNHRCCGQGPADGSFGARMAFGADGLLYVTSGDRNWGERAQDPSSDIGKIVRIRDDGKIPKDNPFVGKDGYRPEIYTLGHRNPTGLTVHPKTHELWSTEFGPRGGDELNRIEAGKNYGWILVTHGAHYNGDPVERGAENVAGMTDPVLFWAPSINPGNIAFYEGDKLPAWRGNLLLATMTRSLVRISFDAAGKPTGQERMLTDLGQRLRDVRQGPDGFVYVLTDETAGAMLRIGPQK